MSVVSFALAVVFIIVANALQSCARCLANKMDDSFTTISLLIFCGKAKIFFAVTEQFFAKT